LVGFTSGVLAGGVLEGLVALKRVLRLGARTRYDHTSWESGYSSSVCEGAGVLWVA